MLDLKTSQYFNSLSKFTQESIMQSGIDFNSDEELLNFVGNLEQ